MEPDNVFGDLRAMLRQTPSEKSFLAIVGALNGLFERSPEEAASRVLPFVVDSMRSWPDEVRLFEYGDATDPDVLPIDGRMLPLARRLRLTGPAHRYDRRGVHDARGFSALLDGLSAGDLPLDLAELHLDVDAFPHRVDTFASLPALRRVRRLSLESTDPSTSPLAAFAKAPWASTVEELFVDGRDATEEEHALLATRPFGALRALDVLGLDVMALEGLYPEVTHLRILAGPERNYSTQRFEDAFPALTSLVLDEVEDAPGELFALGESVVRRLRALEVQGAMDAFSFVSTRALGERTAELTRWCSGLERVALVSNVGPGIAFGPDEPPFAWLDGASLHTLTFTPLAQFDVRAFIEQREGLPTHVFGCVGVDHEGFGDPRPTSLREFALFNTNATNRTRDDLSRTFPDLERLTLALTEFTRYRATPRRLEEIYTQTRRGWMEQLTLEGLHTFTFVDGIGFSSDNLLELYTRAERCGLTRFEVWTRYGLNELDTAFRMGSVPYARIRRFSHITDALTSWRRSFARTAQPGA